MTIAELEFIKYLKRFDEHSFRVEMGGKTYRIGEGKSEFELVVHRTPALSELLTSTSIALGEGYMKGDIEIKGNLYEALDCILGQISKFTTDHCRLNHLFDGARTRQEQKKEVCAHYDIGNDFYRLWLDETLSYSCGYFRQDTDTLTQAQHNKVDYILQKLYLKEGMTLCDIGCGWGYLLIEAAKKYRIQGLGITLSQEQKRSFEEQIQREQLGQYLEVKLMDYRELPGSGRRFDRVVSVGMLEHVGREHYDDFVKCAKAVLAPGGLFLLHFISALREHPGDAWMRKYIFPGGVVPSLREMLQLAGAAGFYTLDVESLRRHYDLTLLCWNSNFQEHREEVRNMFDECFVRMWELYLCACAAAFHNGVVDVHQILLTNGVNNKLPMIRWY